MYAAAEEVTNQREWLVIPEKPKMALCLLVIGRCGETVEKRWETFPVCVCKPSPGMWAEVWVVRWIRVKQEQSCIPLPWLKFYPIIMHELSPQILQDIWMFARTIMRILKQCLSDVLIENLYIFVKIHCDKFLPFTSGLKNPSEIFLDPNVDLNELKNV